ncbi:trigger factor [Bifidobacterium coryneforme]|uniref:Trigger factor n=1 Tax=Bifidobacterium [indicum] DSM 20214 = LMG 11587 TaxID=1341694 RepID=A0A087VTZ9_9BIFI|nr:trigger factor [Bifidobacterium indicum]AIC91799.1 trigger factor [Bifidobacterium indicum LMG 11587 = DSM 20214]
MKISVRNLEPTKVRLTITVDSEELDPYLDQARKEIGKQVTIPGFRKGHVPGPIVDQRVGFASVAGEAINAGVPEIYSKALAEKKLHAMDQPQIDVKDVPQSAKDETKLKFTAEVEIRPKFDLPDLDGMEIEVPKPEVSDEDVDKRLDNLRQRFGTLVSVDRPAKKGDFASIDLDALIDGESVDSQQGISYELGSNTMLDGLDEALDGLSAGEETTFEGTLEAGDHQGEKAQIKVKVNSVKAEELPELDDEFAQEASEFDTLEELKADVRKQCEIDAEGRQATDARDAFIAKLQDGLEIPVPKGIKANMVADQLKNTGKDSEKATKDEKAEAEKNVEKELRDQMTLDALAEKMEVSVSQVDVTNFLASIAQQYGMDPSAFINSIVQNGQLGSAVQEVGRSKGMLAGMRAVTFKDPEGNEVDLTRFLGGDEEDGQSMEDQDESVQAASAAAAVADELSDSDSAEEAENKD